MFSRWRQRRAWYRLSPAYRQLFTALGMEPQQPLTRAHLVKLLHHVQGATHIILPPKLYAPLWMTAWVRIRHRIRITHETL